MSLISRLFRPSSAPALRGPIVVGGVGGSGTRVIAECLERMGVYMGDCLNDSLDNLWYTLLFRSSDMFPDHRNAQEIDRGLALLARAMTRGLKGRPTRAERKLLRRAHKRAKVDRGDQPRKARESLIVSRPPEPDRFHSWGWKEPNSHILLEPLARAFPQMRYVHLVRHGLDMAFSDNVNQLKRWGEHFDSPHPRNRDDLPRAQLRYWVRANRAAVERARELLGERFLLLNFDELCMDPAPHLKRLAGLIGAELRPEILEALSKIPRRPGSTGRYRDHDLSLFDPDDVRAVEELGFTVERP
jgi:hypothetical protein